MTISSPSLTFNFAPDAKRPAKFPEQPNFPAGFSPNAGDGLTFPGSDDIYVVVSRVFSFDASGGASIHLNLALAGSGPE